MGQHNLSNVISFEIMRTVKKKRFWIGMLAMPMMIVIIFALVIFDNSHARSTERAQKNARFTFEYLDQSGLIDVNIVSKLKGHTASSIQEKIGSAELSAIERGGG